MTVRSCVSLVVEDTAWKVRGVHLARIRCAARIARERGEEQTRRNYAEAPWENPQLTILLTNDAMLRRLNARFRGQDAATNVLSFPAAGNQRGYLGDVAIALNVTEREAASAGISLEAHTLHLAVHGVLHLLGYDHVRHREAKVMERLETAILDELGVPSPYAQSADAG